MTTKGTREEKSEARRVLRAVHQEMEKLLEPPVTEYLKTIKTSEIVNAWLRARDTSRETPAPHINPQSGITFAEHRDKLERRNNKILTEFYKSNLQEWLTAWLAGNADQTDHIKSAYPIGIHHPSIAKYIDKISKKCAASQCRSISHLQQETDTDANTVALFYRIAVQNQTQPVGSDEDIQVRYYHAVLQAREALQHIAINQLALGIWYGAVIRREPSIQLTNDHEILMLQACRDSGLNPQDWKAISKFNPNLIADTFQRYPPAAAATAWAALTDLPDPPAVAFINISAKQLANIRKQSNLSPSLFKPIIRAFYMHSIRYKTEGLSPDKLQAHALISEARNSILAKEAPPKLTQIIKAAQQRLEDSPEQTIPQLGWNEWLRLARIPTDQTDTQPGQHGGPTHHNYEVLSAPPLDPKDLDERTNQRPTTPNKSWVNRSWLYTEPGVTLHGTVTELKKRGWNERLITALLGNPDMTKTNPTYTRGAEMRLYERNRVEEAEQDSAFIEHLSKSAKRRESAARTAQNNRNEAMRWAATARMNWVCPTRSIKELKAASRKARKYDNRDTECIDFLIEICSDYPVIASQTVRMQGRPYAAAVLITRLCRDIALHWPELQDESTRRIAKEDASLIFP